MPPPAVWTPSPDEPAGEGPGKALPLQLELPGSLAEATRAAVDAADAEGARGPRMRRTLAKVFAWAALSAGAVAAVWAWLLPVLLRRECVEIAGEHGIELAVERVRIASARGPGAAMAVPGHLARAARREGRSCPEVDVETGAFRPRVVTLRAGSLAYRSPPGELAAAVAKWRSSPSGGEAGGWSPMTVVFEGVGIDWHSPGAGALHAGAADVHATFSLVSRHRGRTEGTGPRRRGRFRSEHVTVDLPDGDRLGPWGVDAERDAAEPRGCAVALDPEVPDGCFLLVRGRRRLHHRGRSGRPLARPVVAARGPRAIFCRRRRRRTGGGRRSTT